jgi:cell division protein FtsI (penicillin-binding protein 3)
VSRLGGVKLRLRSTFLVAAFVLSIFATRLVLLQGIDAEAYAPMAAADGATTVTLQADRGVITDRFGQTLAQTVQGSMLVADPSMTADQATQIAAVLHQRLGLDYIGLVNTLRTPGSRFAYVARQLPPGKADSIMAELGRRGLAGIFDYRDPIRDYPGRDVAGNLIGFVGTEGSGLAGLEHAYDHQLAGVDGSETYETGPEGARIPLASSSLVQPRPGSGLQLTIDRDLQWYVQRRLATAVNETGGDSGAAVVLDTRSGQLLALADVPSVDSADPSAGGHELLGSRAIQDMYEPGSVEKVLTFGSLIDAGYVTPHTKVTVPPALQVGSATIHDWFSHGTEHLTATGVFAISSNIGTALSSKQMPKAMLHHYLRSFGLGQSTDIGLDGESAGLLSPARNWLPINRDTIAFGQGLSVTAIQMAAAVATIANGGVRVAPTLVSGTIDADDQVTASPPPERHRVISRWAARQVTHMMEMVTRPDGLAPDAAIKGYRVAGKTGTAQRVDPSCGCYRGFTISFVGFAPADHPRFLAYIVIQNPRDGSGGGSAGGPVFHDIMAYTLQKYGVAPTGTSAPKLPLTW